MKFKLSKTEHLNKLQLVTKVCKLGVSTHENKSINSDSVVFYQNDEKLYLYSSNAVSSALIYLCEMPIDFKNFGLDAKLFNSAFGNFPTDEVQFAFIEAENQLVFGNKKTRVSLKTSLANDIEEKISNDFFIDKNLKYNFLNSSDLYNAFKLTGFSCAPDFDEHPYTSIMFFAEDGKFNAQSSDKHRISIYGSKYNNESSYLISRNQADLLNSYLSKESRYEYCIYKNKFILKWGDNLFTTTLESNSYQSIFNSFSKFIQDSNHLSTIPIDKNQMSKSIKFIAGISGSHTFHMKVQDNTLVISSSSNDKGAVVDKLTLSGSYQEIEVSFLVSHFIKVFELLSQDIVNLTFNNYNGYVICVVQDSNFDHIMFPME